MPKANLLKFCPATALPVLLYRSEIWAVLREQMKGAEAFLRAVAAYRMTDHIGNEYIREEMGITLMRTVNVSKGMDRKYVKNA
jgi:hypothetical protein